MSQTLKNLKVVFFFFLIMLIYFPLELFLGHIFKLFSKAMRNFDSF